MTPSAFATYCITAPYKIRRCCLTEKVPAVQASGPARLAARRTSRPAPARSHVQVLEHALKPSCFAQPYRVRLFVCERRHLWHVVQVRQRTALSRP